MKFRLSLTVVFSSVVGYLLAIPIDKVSVEIILLIIGGLLVTGSANSFNQILEVKYDSIMPRTQSRPLPLKAISTLHAFFFSCIIGLIGFYCLIHISTGGAKSCFFALASILLYVLVYTPFKRYSPIAIFIGAFPGAIPILLGWVAATNDFGLESGLLFAVQFFWQIPHFVAISWVLDDEYKKAGFKMMIGGKKGSLAVSVSLISSIIMTALSVIPFFCKFQVLVIGLYAMILILLLGLWFTFNSFRLYRNQDNELARKLMLSSFIYLPAIQLIYVLDKFM